MKRLTIILFVLAGASCGGSSTQTDGNPGDGAKHDTGVGIDVGNYDFPCGAGAPCRLDQVCCTMPGATPTFACVAPGSCPAADKITCDGPEDCTGGSICCGTDVPAGTGSFP